MRIYTVLQIASQEKNLLTPRLKTCRITDMLYPPFSLSKYELGRLDIPPALDGLPVKVGEMVKDTISVKILVLR